MFSVEKPVYIYIPSELQRLAAMSFSRKDESKGKKISGQLGFR